MDHPFGKELNRKTLSWQDGPLLTDDTPVALGDKGARENECQVVCFMQGKNIQAGDPVNVIIFSYNADEDEYNEVWSMEFVEGAGIASPVWISSAPGEQLYASLDPEYLTGTEFKLNVQGVYHSTGGASAAA